MSHRGPYRWNANHTMVICEKYIESFDGWVPFAADMSLSDEYEPDRILAEDIYTKLESGAITVVSAEGEPLEEYRASLHISALQFRRGMRDTPNPTGSPVPGETLQDAYYAIMASELIDRDMKEEIEYATILERNDPSVSILGNMFGLSDTDMDAFFEHCKTK